MDYIYLLEMPPKEEYELLTKEESDSLGYDFVTVKENDLGTLDVVPVLHHMGPYTVYIRLHNGYIPDSVEEKLSDFKLLELQKLENGHYINSSEITAHKRL